MLINLLSHSPAPLSMVQVNGPVLDASATFVLETDFRALYLQECSLPLNCILNPGDLIYTNAENLPLT